jgi:transcriptional regulator with XRE-family HTH domain
MTERSGFQCMSCLLQQQLSFRAGLSRPYISQLERNIVSQTVETLFRICGALDVSPVTIIKKVDAARKRTG